MIKQWMFNDVYNRGTTNIQNAPGKAMGSWDPAYFEVEAASAAPALEGHTMAATSSDNLEMLGRSSEEGIRGDDRTPLGLRDHHIVQLRVGDFKKTPNTLQLKAGEPRPRPPYSFLVRGWH